MAWRGKILGFGQDAKTIKSNSVKCPDTGKYFAQAINYMAPADLSGGATLCPMAEEAGCKDACLNWSGNGRYNSVQQSRLNKALWFKADPESFMSALTNDISRFTHWCEKRDFVPVIRLNGTTDIRFENVRPLVFFGLNIFEMHPNTHFLDYTKLVNRTKRPLPKNYHLTWSYSEASNVYASKLHNVLKAGLNAAVVFSGGLPDTFKGYPCINGDNHDLRLPWIDGKGVIVGLSPKGHKWKQFDNGFIIHNEKGAAHA